MGHWQQPWPVIAVAINLYNFLVDFRFIDFRFGHNCYIVISRQNNNVSSEALQV